MPDATTLPRPEGYTRNVLFAAEILDAVTLTPVWEGVKVTATGLSRSPIINHGRKFVWLEEAGAALQSVVIDASGSPYEDVVVPAPIAPARLVRIELAPKAGYPFPQGVTALRGRLRENSPGVAVVGAEIWLQWIDGDSPGAPWRDAPTRSHSNSAGDFAAFMRFSPKDGPKPGSDSGIAYRLCVRRAGVTRTSLQKSLPVGRVSSEPQPFIWSELAS